MKKSFLKHFAVIGIGTLTSMIIGVLTTPIITRLVDPVEYGQMSIFTMYSQIAVMVLCMGLDQALVRYYYVQEKLEYRRALLFKCIKLPLITSFLFCGLFIFLTHWHIIRTEFNEQIIAFLCFYSIMQLLYRFSLLIIRLEHNSKLYSILNIMQKLLYILIVIPLAVSFKKDYLFVLIIGTIISLLVCLLISVIAKVQMWLFCKKKEDLNIVSQKELLKYAYPYVISMSITTLFQAIDKISLNYYCTYVEVGIYSSTMTLIHVFSVVQTTFNALWAPMAVEHYSNNREDKDFYQKGNSVITIIMFFIGINLILIKDIFAILLGEKYREAAYILPFLIFNPIMYTISETTVNGLVFMKKSKMQIVVAFVACAANIFGNAILVPIYGPKGAAISTGFSYIIFFAMRTLLSNRYFYIDFKLNKFYILTGIVVVYAFYNTFIAFNVGTVIGYLLCMVSMVILYKETFIWCINYGINVLKKYIK